MVPFMLNFKHIISNKRNRAYGVNKGVGVDFDLYTTLLLPKVLLLYGKSKANNQGLFSYIGSTIQLRHAQCVVWNMDLLQANFSQI